MARKKQIIVESVRLEKLVHGGQCLGYVEKNAGERVFFVWGGLPGELVDVRITKKKRSYQEGIVIKVIESSPQRIEPREPEVYISSSPWQIMEYALENQSKQAILEETFTREGAQDIGWNDFYADEQQYGYRNKVELGFWGDDDGIHFASYIRGTHGKRIVTSNALAGDAINAALPELLAAVRDFAHKNSLRAGDLKTTILRSSQDGAVVAALFVKKDIDCSSFELPGTLKGVDIYYSDPKSPASVPTKKIYSLGDITLTDAVMGKNIMYDVLSFFQVNLPVFNETAKIIEKHVAGQQCVDFYAGVGTIGLPVGATALVDVDESNIAMARQNAAGTDVKVVHAESEKALEYIESGQTIIVDPPRAGLHSAFTQQLLDIAPQKIIYLSCNPSTQARDVKLLQEKYKVTHAQGFNFFPRTPHIESLVVLELK